MRKEDKYLKWIIGISITSIVVIAFLLFTTFSGIFAPKIADSGNFTLGDDIRILAQNNKSVSSAQTFSGNFLPNDNLLQNLTFDFDENFLSSFIRVKATTKDNNNNEIFFKFKTEKDWLLKDDNYYYFLNPINPNSSLKFCSQITMPETSENFNSNKTYTIIYTIESLPIENNYTETLWKIPS